MKRLIILIGFTLIFCLNTESQAVFSSQQGLPLGDPAVFKLCTQIHAKMLLILRVIIIILQKLNYIIFVGKLQKVK
jgi:hypothetical protein